MPKKISADLRLLEPFWREPIERSVLPNGLTVLLKPDRSAALASVQVWVKTGSIHEGTKLGAGLSHFLEHMLFKGTERRAGRDISAAVQAHGGYINAYTTFDHTVYYIDLPSEHVAVAVDLLADAVLHSTLPADEVTRERDVILREIDMTRDDPEDRLATALFATAFRTHPYLHPVIGHRDVFSAVTRDDLLEYYRTRYTAGNLTVIIAGDIEPATARAEIEKYFGAVPRAALAPVFIPNEPPPLAPRAQHLYEKVELTRAFLAWQIPGLTHPDAPLFDMLAGILGRGDSSILWQAIREKARLVHTIDAQSWNPGSVGLFSISFTCDAGKREAAAAAVERELVRCAARGFTAAELKKSLRQFAVGEINTRKTMSGQAARLGLAEVVVGDLDYSRGYFERLAAATPAELQRVLETYLIPSRLISVSSNPVQSAPAAKPSRADSAGAADFEEIKLPNGARLLLQPDSRLPNLHLRLACLGGPLYENPGKRGATALLATLLTKDTRQRTAAQVARTIEEVGGAFYPFSGNNAFGLAIEVLPTDLDRALTLLSEAVFSPAFRPQTFSIECDAQLAELQQDADDIVAFSRKLLRKKFFGEHPFAIDVTGDEAGLRALAPGELARLHRTLLTAPNAVLAVSGDFSTKKLAPRLRAFLSELSAAPAPRPVSRFSGPAAADLVEKQPREQAVVLQAFPGPRLLANDFYVGEVADELFSGMASRLFERVREEKGLAYFVRSSRITGIDTAMFYFYAGTAPAHAAEVLAEIDAEISRVQSGGVEETELRRCQARLKAGRRQSLQPNSARAMHAALNALYGLPVNDWKSYDARIEAVTCADLAKFAQNYFQRSHRVQLVVGP